MLYNPPPQIPSVTPVITANGGVIFDSSGVITNAVDPVQGTVYTFPSNLKAPYSIYWNGAYQNTDSAGNGDILISGNTFTFINNGIFPRIGDRLIFLGYI